MSKNEIKNTREKAENLHQQEWGSILAEETQLSRVQRKVAMLTGVVKESTT